MPGLTNVFLAAVPSVTPSSGNVNVSSVNSPTPPPPSISQNWLDLAFSFSRLASKIYWLNVVFL